MSGFPLLSLSKATKAPLTSQPLSRNSASTAITSSSDTAYGGSANTMSNASIGGPSPGRPAGPLPRKRATLSATTSAPPPRSSALTFVLIVRTALGSDSTSTAQPAPRDSASSPTAPDPAYRSITRAPRSPYSESSVKKIPSRALSLVGLVPRPGGTSSRRPPALPAMIRVMSAIVPHNDAGQEWTSVGLDCARVIHIAR